MNILSLVFIFFAVIAVVEGIVLFFFWRSNPEKKRINQQLKVLARQREQLVNDHLDITRKSRELSSIPWFNQLLQRIPRRIPTDRLIEQARAP